MTVYLSQYRPPVWQIPHIKLCFELGREQTSVTSRLEVDGVGGDLVLDGHDLRLESLEVTTENGQPWHGSYDYDGKQLTITQVPRKAWVHTKVQIHPAKNTQLMGLYTSGEHLCTQCEAEGFRNITFCLDRPDVMSQYQVTLIAEQQQYPILLSNGNLVQQEQLSDGRHLAVWHDPWPKPCYLFALVAGDFDVIEDSFMTQDHKEIALLVYVEKGHVHQASFAMASLKRAMQWDEDTYGLSYDLERFMLVAVADFNMGAMENKGLNIFNMKYVMADQYIATDNDYFNIESVVAHEYFHNWTGNRVTCRDWFQLTLKEGLTVFRDQTFSEDLHDKDSVRLSEIIQLKRRQFLEDASPMAHPIQPKSYDEINNFYTATVYEKGAEIIRMYETILGTKTFRQAVKCYLERYDGQAVTVQEFLETNLSLCKEDLSHFQYWYDQVGTPSVSIKRMHDGKTTQLLIKQDPVYNQEGETLPPLVMPLYCSVFSNDEVVFEQCLLLKDATMVVELSVPQNQHCVYAFNQSLTSPVMVEDDLSIDECIHVLRLTKDAYTQWHMIQRIHRYCIVRQLPPIESFISAITTLFAHTKPGVMAQLLTMPSLMDFVNEKHFSIKGTQEALTQYHTLFAIKIKGLIVNHWDHCEQAALTLAMLKGRDERSLFAVLLHHWVVSKDPHGIKKAVTLFEQSPLFGIKMACIQSILQQDGALSNQLFDQLMETSKHPNIVNQWFTSCGKSLLGDRIAAVTWCINSQHFSWKNPNNVYALLGSLARNVYALVSEQGLLDQLLAWIHHVDQINGQVASRVLQPLVGYQAWDDASKNIFNQSFKRFSLLGNHSKDVSEVLDRLNAASS